MVLDPRFVRAPELSGEWLNSPAVRLREQRGKVVLVDFWEYTCINCIRTLPYVREWHHRYRDKGLVVIGVHTPEFEFAGQPENVRAAMREFAIDYPVLLDAGYASWYLFANSCWPAKYLIDRAGYIRYSRLGEGAYGDTEEAIQALLRDANPTLDLPPVMEPVRATDRPGAVCERATPETAAVRLPNARSGAWNVRDEFLECAGDARFDIDYRAAEVNVVMAGAGTIDILDDGKPLDHQSRGEDIREMPDGRTVIEVERPRMYSIVKRDRFLSRHLTISTSSPGLQLYAFSFVSCVPRP